LLATSASSCTKAAPMKAATTRPSLASGMRQHVAHEVNPTLLPRGMQHDALVGVGDRQLDAAKPAARELAQELGPERLGLGGPCPTIGHRRCEATPVDAELN
jgi:hypothetical protein